MGNDTINVIIGAVLGAIISALGFVLKSVLDQISIKRELKQQIIILCELCLLAYKNNDQEKCQSLLCTLFSKYSTCRKNNNIELFTDVFEYSYKTGNYEKLKASFEKIRKELSGIIY